MPTTIECYGTRSVPTPINVYLFLSFTIIVKFIIEVERRSPFPTKDKRSTPCLVVNNDRCSLPIIVFFQIYRSAGYGSSKIADLQRGDIVGFHGSSFNSTYVLPNVNRTSPNGRKDDGDKMAR